MRHYGGRSIKRKLISLSMAASGFALLLAGTAVIAYELTSLKTLAARELTAIAQVVGGAGNAALVFEDPGAAGEVLSALRGESRVVEGALYRASGAALASFSRGKQHDVAPASPLPDGVYSEGRRMRIFRPIVIQGERVGTVYLKADLTEAYDRLERHVLILLAVLVLSLLATLAVSIWMQRIISRPLLSLADTARRVSEEENYSLRAERMADDEVGVLVDSFNEMMHQVHTRDVALRAAHDELEDRVKQRTRELVCEIGERKNVEKDLIAARDQAEQSSRAKSTFLANMSHELRTPLNAIIGYSEMLEEDALEEGNKSAVSDLKRIHNAGRHLLALINDILDISKIEAGRMELRPEPFNIGEVIEQTTSTLEPIARQRGNRLEVRCAEPNAIMHADLLKFRQSLLNLLANACKFTEGGTVTLDVSRRNVNGAEYFDWAVSDTGIGIAQDQMQKLFHAFSQVDGSYTRRFGGTGLGLAISQRLCRLMGGEIRVESEVGKGSTFTMRVPAHVPANLLAGGRR